MMRYTRRIVLGLVLLGAGWCQAANPFTVTCSVGFNGKYRPGEWTPLEIQISSVLTEPFEGRIHIDSAQDAVQRMQVSQAFVLTPGVPLHLPLVTKLAYGADFLSIRLADTRERILYEQTLGLWGGGQAGVVSAVQPQDLFVGLVGQRFGILSLTQAAECDYQSRSNGNPNTGSGQVIVESKLPAMVPWDWTGFAGLDLLVLYDPDWSQLRAEQIQAVVDWVRQGGRLLVLLGRSPMPTSALTEALPVRVDPLAETLVPGAWLDRWALPHEGAPRVTCRRLSARTGASLDSAAEDLPFLATGHLGFGRVTVVGLDPRDLAGSRPGAVTEFWLKVMGDLTDRENVSLDMVDERGRRVMRHYAWQAALGAWMGAESRHIRLKAATQDPTSNSTNYGYQVQQPAYQTTTRVLDYLYAIDAMRPLSIGWVVLLLLILAVLLGPVDYLVLKRLDRLPWTWVTSLGWIVLFTVGAYYGVQYLRAGDMQLRTVGLIDGIQGDGPAWSTRVCGLFAPKSDEYRLDGLAPGQWWSGIAASSGRWNASMGRSARRTLYFDQRDGSNWPAALPINIWTMQTLCQETPVRDMPIRAELTLQGDAFSLALTNQSRGRIAQGLIMVDSGRGARLGPIPSGQTETFTGTLGPVVQWVPVSSDTRIRGRARASLAPEDVMGLIGTEGRSEGIRDLLGRGAAVVCVQFEDLPRDVTVAKGACLYHHIQIARLVVFPE